MNYHFYNNYNIHILVTYEYQLTTESVLAEFSKFLTLNVYTFCAAKLLIYGHGILMVVHTL